MPRLARFAPGGIVYQVLNRANGRLRLFESDEDFAGFERILMLAHERKSVLPTDCGSRHL